MRRLFVGSWKVHPVIDRLSFRVLGAMLKVIPALVREVPTEKIEYSTNSYRINTLLVIVGTREQGK